MHIQDSDDSVGQTDDTDSGQTYAAGEDLSDEEMVDQVAEQTDSASARAHDAGKDWDGQSTAPDPSAG